MAVERQALCDRMATVQRFACERAHRGNRGAAWRGDEDDDLIQQATVVVREMHQREPCEAKAARKLAVARTAANAQVEAEARAGIR
jgi:hypothetical protein